MIASVIMIQQITYLNRFVNIICTDYRPGVVETGPLDSEADRGMDKKTVSRRQNHQPPGLICGGKCDPAVSEG